MNNTTTAYLGLGSNMGDRMDNIRTAIESLKTVPGIEVQRIAEFLESEPVGLLTQNDFFNTAVEIITTLTARKLLKAVKAVEEEMGRDKTDEWGPRNIDIDILFFGSRIIVADDLVVPHPLVCERIFVLKPMADLQPGLEHPVFGKALGQIFEERERELSLYHCLEL